MEKTPKLIIQSSEDQPLSRFAIFACTQLISLDLSLQLEKTEITITIINQINNNKADNIFRLSWSLLWYFYWSEIRTIGHKYSIDNIPDTSASTSTSN